jgi:hypothetical protein
MADMALLGVNGGLRGAVQTDMVARTRIGWNDRLLCGGRGSQGRCPDEQLLLNSASGIL